MSAARASKRLLAAAVAAASALWASAAFPCGAPFGPGMSVDPHQDIIIAHKAGVETYVFQPTVCGRAADFGMVLPVPALLSASPSLGDAEAFAVLDALSLPRHEARTECGGFGTDAGVGGGGGNGGSDGTAVVASGRVGFLDWVQLEAKDQASFTAWLDANGYPYDAAAKSAFDYYVGKHWYFLAFKVAQNLPAGAINDCLALGPIRLDFPSATPVVPSRMAIAGATNADAGPDSHFTWRIFGITAGTEQLEFASASWTEKLSFAGAITGDLTHLAGLATAGDRLTKLQLWFDGTATEDKALKLVAPADLRETVYDVTYVDCSDAGTDADASADGALSDGAVSDAGLDAGRDGGGGASAGGGGCAFGSGAERGAAFAALVAALALATRRRRR